MAAISFCTNWEELQPLNNPPFMEEEDPFMDSFDPIIASMITDPFFSITSDDLLIFSDEPDTKRPRCVDVCGNGDYYAFNYDDPFPPPPEIYSEYLYAPAAMEMVGMSPLPPAQLPAEGTKKSCLSVQSVAARERRKRISEKTQELGKLVPGGHKMNTAEMFTAAGKYIRFLQVQVGILDLLGSIQESKGSMKDIDEQMSALLASSAVQEKLSEEEKCVVPRPLIDALANDRFPTSVSRELKRFMETIQEELNQPVPPDFAAKISQNCSSNPHLRYCNHSSSDADIRDIFKSTIVATHICHASNNPDCSSAFEKIDLRARPKVAPLYLSFEFFWRYCPLSILTIDFSNNSLESPFPSQILQCSQIDSLDLSHNELVGDFPLEGVSALHNLTFLNVSYNHFSKSRIKSTQLRPDLLPSILQRQHSFTPSMLKGATDGFAEENLVEKSRKSETYRGVLSDGTEVGIEVWRGRVSSEFHKIFIEECRVLMQLDHDRLISVLGWCDRRELRAVVKEWVDGESVEEWLSRSPSWRHRLKVLVGVVEAIRYLQEQWPLIDYDLRTCNVIVTENQEPLVSKLKVGDQRSESEKVYKFGVFLLELVANRRPQEEFERGETEFVEWMRMHYPENVGEVIDGAMKRPSRGYDQLVQAIGIGLSCTDIEAGGAPGIKCFVTMSDEVVQLLKDLLSTREKPDAITFLVVMTVCNHSGMVDEGLRYLESMEDEHPIKPRWITTCASSTL
ncbi:Transcription factor bHLH52 [Acorus calamus]|uniref:Transcription factor bHLH52 n=1 Tax=Acorus calamus TaxID=4465 RepID=A0AAV9DUU8_ACOCL|nr:Transcription factor bHLH52 [Acorus calamus]